VLLSSDVLCLLLLSYITADLSYPNHMFWLHNLDRPLVKQISLALSPSASFYCCNNRFQIWHSEAWNKIRVSLNIGVALCGVVPAIHSSFLYTQLTYDLQPEEAYLRIFLMYCIYGIGMGHLPLPRSISNRLTLLFSI